MDNELAKLEQQRTGLKQKLMKLKTSDRETRHKLLDMYADLDSQIMILQTKQGLSECDGCGKWTELTILKLDKLYHVCKICCEAETE